jgi:uncharacterized protein (TIGR03437 family)
MIRAIAVLMATGLTVCGQAKILAIVDAATFKPGLPYGGGLATIFVSSYGSQQPGTYLAPPSGPLPFVLAGVTVEVNAARCPLLAVVIPSDLSTPVQINFQVPLERNASILTQLPDGFPGNIAVAGVGSAFQSPLPGPPNFGGGFYSDAKGYVTAQHWLDNSPVTLQNPARPGEVIIAYANDFFPVWPAPPIGFATPSQPLFQISTSDAIIPDPGHLYLQTYPRVPPPPPFPVAASITNTPPLAILFQGLAPGLVGVEQINFVVPSNQQSGDWPLFFNDGCAPGQLSGCSLAPNSSTYAMLPVR